MKRNTGNSCVKITIIKIIPSWTNTTAVNMAEINAKRAFLEINFSEGRSPLFSILTSVSVLSMSKLVTQGEGSIENVSKVG